MRSLAFCFCPSLAQARCIGSHWGIDSWRREDGSKHCTLNGLLVALQVKRDRERWAKPWMDVDTCVVPHNSRSCGHYGRWNGNVDQSHQGQIVGLKRLRCCRLYRQNWNRTMVKSGAIQLNKLLYFQFIQNTQRQFMVIDVCLLSKRDHSICDSRITKMIYAYFTHNTNLPRRRVKQICLTNLNKPVWGVRICTEVQLILYNWVRTVTY